jgi:hypothetical protein
LMFPATLTKSLSTSCANSRRRKAAKLDYKHRGITCQLKPRRGSSAWDLLSVIWMPTNCGQSSKKPALT